jgi:rhodanese-related sulfurtransferase
VNAASLAAKRGYTNIMVFRDGIPGWRKAGYPIKSPAPLKKVAVPAIEPAQLSKSLDAYLVVDIRPENGYKNGYIPGSRAMPLAYLSLLAVELSKEDKLVVVDHNGKQAQNGARWLKSNGFEDVCYLKGGLTGYAAKGFNLEK